MNEHTENYGLSSLDLKIIAVVLMTIDHIGAFVNGMPFALRMIGRLSAPLFFFCLVEGFFHTRSHSAYLKRLGIGAAVMALGNEAMRLLINRDGISQPNIFFSMAVCYILMLLLKNMTAPGSSGIKILGLALLAVAACALIINIAEYHIYLFAMVLPFYFFHGKKRLLLAAYAIVSMLVWLIDQPPGLSFNNFSFDVQWLMIFSAVILLFYNGRAGRKSPLAKHFFYLYYPLHIWGLILLNEFVIGR